jgi:hypothetical protein
MENCKKDYKSLVSRCELQIRTSALNNSGANPEEQGIGKPEKLLQTLNKMK